MTPPLWASAVICVQQLLHRALFPELIDFLTLKLHPTRVLGLGFKPLVVWLGSNSESSKHEAQWTREHSEGSRRLLPVRLLLVPHCTVQQLRDIAWMLPPLDQQAKQLS